MSHTPINVDCIGIVFKKFREKTGKTQEEVSKSAGLTVNFISRFENGHKGAELATLNKLAQAIDLDTVVILQEASSGMEDDFKAEPRKKVFYPLAVKALSGREAGYWIRERQKKWVNDQLGLADALVPILNKVADGLPLNAQIVWVKLLTYSNKGVSIPILAKACRMQEKQVRVYLGRLRESGLAMKESRGIYIGAPDFLLPVSAVRWDARWPAWRKKNREKHSPEEIITRFMESTYK